MKRRRAGRELFEVFRHEPEAKLKRSWWLKRNESPADKTGKSEPAKPKRARPKAVRRDATTPPGRVTLTFSREALIICLVIGAGVILGSFALGYARGKSTEPRAIAQVNTQGPQGSAPDVPPYSSLTLNMANDRAFFTLRLLDNLTHESAAQIVIDLRAMGYNAFELRNVDKYSVNAGYFVDYRTGEAEAYKEKIKQIVYKDKRWFSSAHWIQIPRSTER